MEELANLHIRVRSAELETARRRTDALSRSAVRAERRTAALSAAFLRFAAPVALLTGATTGLREVVRVGREFGVLRARLETATGSAQAAADQFVRLQNFASRTPFDLQQVTGAFIRLQNLGLEPSEAALESYGNTAAAMGTSLNQLIEAVADAATGEFERLKEFGIRTNREGDNVRFTFRGVTTTVRNSSEEIQGYLLSLGETEFAGGMTRQVMTLEGAISNLSDSWDQFVLNFSEGTIGSSVEAAIRGLTSILVEYNRAARAERLAREFIQGLPSSRTLNAGGADEEDEAIDTPLARANILLNARIRVLRSRLREEQNRIREEADRERLLVEIPGIDIENTPGAIEQLRVINEREATALAEIEELLGNDISALERRVAANLDGRTFRTDAPLPPAPNRQTQENNNNQGISRFVGALVDAAREDNEAAKEQEDLQNATQQRLLTQFEAYQFSRLSIQEQAQEEHRTREEEILSLDLLNAEARAQLLIANEMQLQETLRSIREQERQNELQAQAFLYASLSELAGQFADRQTTAGRIAFAAQKAFAVASSILSINQALARSQAEGTTAAERIIEYARIVSLGANIIGTLQSTQPQGFRQGGVVEGASFFGFQNERRVGFAGEAGPEAILPLARLPGGNLGVQAMGDTGGTVNTINISPSITVSVTEGDGQVIGEVASQQIVETIETFVREQQRPGGILSATG